MSKYGYIRHDEMSGYAIAHHGIKGQKWGVRRYQNPDGSLTPLGKQRYGTVANFEAHQAKKKKIAKAAAIAGGAIAGTAIASGAGLLMWKAIDQANKQNKQRYTEMYKDENLTPETANDLLKRSDKLLKKGNLTKEEKDRLTKRTQEITRISNDLQKKELAKKGKRSNTNIDYGHAQNLINKAYALSKSGNLTKEEKVELIRRTQEVIRQTNELRKTEEETKNLLKEMKAMEKNDPGAKNRIIKQLKNEGADQSMIDLVNDPDKFMSNKKNRLVFN